MSISKKDVEHIAHLARIEVSEDEAVRFEEDLEEILGFVGELKEADTAGVESMAGGLVMKRPETLFEEAREDEEVPPLGNPGELVGMAPRRKEGWIEVGAVL